MNVKELRKLIKEEISKVLIENKFTHPSHINNYSIYLSTEPIYTSLPIDRLKSVLFSLKELGEDLDDYIIMKNSTGDTKPASELEWDLSNVKPFDNLQSLKSKIEALS
jgi:hypothetical protein